jgi:hypothetical protein
MMIKKYIDKTALVLSFFVLTFTVAAQSSNALILWLNPNHVSTKDERFFYTIFPAFLCLLLLALVLRTFRKTKANKPTLLVTYSLFLANLLLFVYYLYYQYFHFPGDWYLF